MYLDQILLTTLALINIFAFLVMANDKRKSMAGGNPDRVPEVVLFFLATAGGSIGIYAAMILLRHKTRKWYFQVGIPLIILQNVAAVYGVYSFISTY